MSFKGSRQKRVGYSPQIIVLDFPKWLPVVRCRDADVMMVSGEWVRETAVANPAPVRKK